jgi:hypothetical protein
MSKNKVIGLFLVIGPMAMLIFILVAYAIASFVSTAMIAGNENINVNANINAAAGLAEESVPSTAMNVIRMVLGLLGIIAVIGILVGVPLGIYFLAKKEGPEVLAKLKAKPEFASLSDEQLLFLGKVSWGAFFGCGIWALGNKLYLWALPYIILLVIGILNTVISFLAFTQPQILTSLGSLPMILTLISFPLAIASFVIFLWLFIKGRELAWAKGWTSFDQFKQRQKLMSWIILGIIILSVVLQLGAMIYMMSKVPAFDDQVQLDTQSCMSDCLGDDNSAEHVRTCLAMCENITE